MTTFEKLQLLKDMITQQVVYQTILISKKYYKMTVKDLSRQQALDADPKAIQQINFTGNLDRDNGTSMFFNIEEAK